MNNFSIRDIEMLSGINAHTLRIWEQRHGLHFCKRRDSQHRYYDNEDLKAILRVAYLYHNGYKISKIASLTTDEISRLVSADTNESSYDLCINQLIEATLDYDQVKFENNIRFAMLHYGFDRSVVKIFYPFLQKLGLLWITEHLIPAQEHFSCALIQQKIIAAIDSLEPSHLQDDYSVLIFAPEGEFHEIPLLIALYLFKKHRIKTVYFGANVPIAYLEYYCKYKSVTHLFTHLATSLQNKEPAEYINYLAEKFPAVSILASGPALQNNNILPAKVKVVHQIEDLIPSVRV